MITAVVLTKNEEKNISECLASLKWCDEVIVIDDKSQDNTVQLAQSTGAIVYVHLLDNNFSKQRNFGLEKATNDWVLFIDADERVPLSLNYEILNIINNPIDTASGYNIKRTDILWRRRLQHGDAGNTQLLRLAKKNSGMWKGTVHETWQVKGKVERLKNVIEHYPHQTISEFLSEINYYTDIRAQELFEKKRKYPTTAVLYYPLGKFFYTFFIKLGFLDGIAGLITALLMSFHSFLVRGKLWQLWKKNK